MSLDFFVGGGSAPLPTYAVEIWSDSMSSPGEPGSLAHTLTNPSALNIGVNAFTATGNGIDLDANTTYHVVLNNAPEANTRFLSIETTTSDNEDGGAAAGWSIADGGHFRAHGSEGSWSSFSSSVKLAVRGYAKDTVAPTLSTAAVEGTTLTLTYSEALDAASVPAASAFTVTVDGSDVSLADAGPIAIDGATVVLTLAAAVTPDQTVTVSYAVPSTNPIQDPAGNDAAALTNQAVATPPIALSLSATSVVEGGSVTVTASLGMAAASDTTVTVSAAAGPDTTAADFTLSATTTLTIAAGQTASTGTVSIATTDDSVDRGARSVTVSATATGGVTDAPADVTLTITENDARGVTVSASTLAVDEGASDTYTVVLDSEPTATVTVTPTSQIPSFATVSGPLTFTTSDWATPQTVTVTGVEDTTLTGDRVTTITHAVVGGDYEGEATDSVRATVNDNDVPGLDFSASILSVAEAGGSDTYTVRLDNQPLTTVTVTLSSSPAGIVTLGPSTTLSFTRANWNTAQTVTVTGVNDDIDNPADRTATITHRGSGGGYDSVSETVTVTATDDDVRGVTVSTTALAVGEGGGAGAYTVVLDSEPTASVTVTPMSDDTDAATVSAALTFTTSDWATPQTVTVTGVEDMTTNTPDRAATITHTVAGGDYASETAASVTVTVNDNDVPGLTFSASTLDVAEAGGTATYGVRLNTQPSGTVTVTPNSGDPAVASVSGDLTFTASDWATEQTVTVTGVNDDIDNPADRTATITHRASGGGYDSVGGSVTATAIDDDIRGVTVSASTLAVDEGAAGAYTIVLDTEPTDTVTVTPASSDTDVATVGAALSFTTSNWATPQSVAVTGVEDDQATGARMTMITHTVAGGDYASEAAAPVAVTVADDEPVATAPGPPTGVMATAGDGELEISWSAPADDGGSPVTGYQLRYTSDGGASYSAAIPAAAPPHRLAGLVNGTSYTVEVRAVNAVGAGDWSAGASGTPEKPDEGRARRLDRMEELKDSAVTQFMRGSAIGAVEAIVSRIGAGGPPPQPGGSLSEFAAGLLNLAGSRDGGAGRDLFKGLDRRTLALSLGGGPGSDAPTLWLSGSYRDSELENSGALDWDGEERGAQAGLDWRLGDSFVAGLGVSYFDGDFDYIDRLAETAVEGRLEATMTSLHPYVGGSLGEGASFWGLAGIGRGEIEISEDSREVQQSDTEQVMAALGGSYRLRGDGAGSTAVDLKAEAWAARLRIDGNDDLIRAEGLDAGRLRLMAEASRAFVLGAGGQLEPSLAVALREDVGDGLTGRGFELNAGLAYRDPARGLSLRLDGRHLLSYDEDDGAGDLEEWGLGGSLTLRPAADGRGLTLSLTQALGALSGGAEQFWQAGGRPSGAAPARSALRTEARLSYGLHGFGGLLTPYAEANHEAGAAAYGRLGAAWVRDALSFDLAVESPRASADGACCGLRLQVKGAF